MNKFLVSLLTILLVLFVSAPRFGAVADTVTLLDAALSASKSEVKPGETFTYTFEVTNVTSDVTVNPLFIAPTLSALVDYVVGSGTAYKGSYTAAVPDAWLTDGLNLGKLNPGASAKIVFDVKVKGSATNSAIIESVIQINKTWLPEGKNEWFQCANRITVKTGEVLGAADELPNTGPEDVFATSLYLGYLGFLLRRLKLTKYF